MALPTLGGVHLHCRWTALHRASDNGHTETVKVLMAADASVVHSKDSAGCDLPTGSVGERASGRRRCGKGLAVQIASGRMGASLQCRLIALHFASLNGHTETAMALLAEKADVHCRDDKGYAQGRCIARSRPDGLFRFTLRCGKRLAVPQACVARAFVFCAGGRRCTMRR